MSLLIYTRTNTRNGDVLALKSSPSKICVKCKIIPCLSLCACVYLCVCWLPACPRSYLFSDVRRQFCLYVLLCMFDSRLVHASRAHTLPRLLSYMPGFRLCVHCSVIIQRGKQPAPDLISCLGSHIEVGKHYQLITVLPASPAFFFLLW